MTPWLALLLTAASAEVLPVEVVLHTLDNGLRVYLAPMDTPGIVSLQTWVDVGSGREIRSGTTGHAHFLEHLLFTDTARFPASERDRFLRTSGAEENAWTWLDDTVYHMTLPAEALPELLRYDAGRFQDVLLEDATIQREAGAVQGEWRQSQTWPSEALLDGLYAAAFPDHPYGHSTLGSDEDVAAMPQAGEQVREFLTTWYRPEALRIVVVGDFEPSETLAQVTSLWGSWTGPESPPPAIPSTSPPAGPLSLVVPWEAPGTNPWAAVGWHVPGRDLSDPDSAALAILDELLLSDVAPLRRTLIDDEALAHDLAGGQWRFRDPHLLMLYAELKPETDPQALFDAVDAEIARVHAGVEPERLAAVKTRAAKAFRLRLDDPHRVASAIAQATAYDPDPAILDQWFAALDAVSAQDLTGVIDTYLVPAGRVQAVLGSTEAP